MIRVEYFKQSRFAHASLAGRVVDLVKFFDRDLLEKALPVLRQLYLSVHDLESRIAYLENEVHEWEESDAAVRVLESMKDQPEDLCELLDPRMDGR